MINSRIKQLTEMLADDPQDAFLKYALALEYDKLNNSGDAIKLLEEIILTDENYLAAYYQLGKIYEKTNDQAKALKIFEKGMEIADLLKNRRTYNELKASFDLLKEELDDKEF